MCESPIDAMSRATIELLHGKDWRSAHYISLGCLSDQALERFLQHNQITEIVFCLDNDANTIYTNDSLALNWGQEAAMKFDRKYKDLGYSTTIETPDSKDVNGDLITIRISSELVHKHSKLEDMHEY